MKGCVDGLSPFRENCSEVIRVSSLIQPINKARSRSIYACVLLFVYSSWMLCRGCKGGCLPWRCFSREQTGCVIVLYPSECLWVTPVGLGDEDTSLYFWAETNVYRLPPQWRLWAHTHTKEFTGFRRVTKAEECHSALYVTLCLWWSRSLFFIFFPVLVLLSFCWRQEGLLTE